MKKILIGMLIIALVSVFGVFASAERSDFNNDGNVNLEDFFLFAQSFSARAGDILYESKYDLDSNNKVDMEDFNIFSSDFNEKISPSHKEVSKYDVNKIQVIPYGNRVDAHITLRNLGDKKETVYLRAYLIDGSGRIVSRTSDSDVRLALREVHRSLLSLNRPEPGKYILVVEADNNKQNGYVRRYMDVEVK